MIDFEDLKRRLSSDDILKIFQQGLKEEGISVGGDEFKFTCPFHDDKDPSMHVNMSPEKFGTYNCFVCSSDEKPMKSGNLWNFIEVVLNKDPKKVLSKFLKKAAIAEKKPETPKILKTIDPNIILEAKKTLQKNMGLRRVLTEFGITEKFMMTHDVGYGGGRYWFPIRNASGDFVNVRMYDPHAKKSQDKWISWKKGYGEARWYPIGNLQSDTIYLMEGEKDTAVACSMGLNAVTQTAGADTWKKDWTQLFKNKNVVICYDIDPAGRTGAIKVCKELFAVAAQVKNIVLPLNETEFPKGDFTDWVCQGHDLDEFMELVDNQNVFVENNVEADNIEYKCILAEASKAKYHHKKCDIKNVIIVGADTAPFSVPKTIVYSCSKGTCTAKKCAACKVNGNTYTKTFEKDDYDLAEFIDVPNKSISGKLKNILQEPCTSLKMQILDYYSVERFRLSPNTSSEIDEKYKHAIRVGIFVSDKNDADSKKIETNKTYDIKAMTINNPKTQHVIHLIYDSQPSQSNLDTFQVTPDIHKQLQAFQVQPGQTVQQKLDQIYSDLSKNARIFARNDLFQLFDMSFHSALTFNFMGKSIGKGWVEVCVIGDTGQGKSEAIKFLRQYYKCGETVDGESLTTAGLKGGLSQSGGVWQLQWGRLPINDQGLVIIDEAGGMPVEAIAELSNIRSSGECSVTKVLSDKTRARTRIIWIANPRRQNMGIKNYHYGVQTIFEFFGKPEDTRRVDAAMTLATGEVDSALINVMPEDIVTPYTSDACHNLIQFAWSRKADQINIPKEVAQYVLDVSGVIGKKYSAAIPLVELSDVRNKIIRLAVATAMRVYSVDSDFNLVVTIDHVKCVMDFLEHLYTKPRMAYDQFSIAEHKKDTIKNFALAEQMLGGTEKVLFLMQQNWCFHATDAAAVIDCSVQDSTFSRTILALKMENIIQNAGPNIYKFSPAYIEYMTQRQGREIVVPQEKKSKF